MKSPRTFFRHVFRLGRFRLRVEFAAAGICTGNDCAYSNDWCPNGCKEVVHLDV